MTEHPHTGDPAEEDDDATILADKTVVSERDDDDDHTRLSTRDDDDDDHTRLSTRDDDDDHTRLSSRDDDDDHTQLAQRGDSAAPGHTGDGADHTVAVARSADTATGSQRPVAANPRSRSPLPPGTRAPSRHASSGSFGSDPQAYAKRALPPQPSHASVVRSHDSQEQPRDGASVLSPEQVARRRARAQSKRRAVAITIGSVAGALSLGAIAALLMVLGVFS